MNSLCAVLLCKCNARSYAPRRHVTTYSNEVALNKTALNSNSNLKLRLLLLRSGLPPHVDRNQPQHPSTPLAVAPAEKPRVQIARRRRAGERPGRRQRNKLCTATPIGKIAMSGGHNKQPAPPVATTGCSALMSCLSFHRRVPPPPPARANVDGSTARATRASAEQYRRRVQLLEEEVRRLGKRLAADAEHGKSVNGGFMVTRDQVTSACSGIGATAANKCVTVGGHGGGGNGGVQEMVRLEDGGYLHEIKRVVGMPWERLALQVSQPVVAENAATASEVLDKMTETSAEDLCKFLLKMMPIKDIAGRKNPGNVIRRSARLSSGDDFLEALLLMEMDKMEGLVQQGLKIHMASTADSASSTAAGDDGQRHQTTKDSMVSVVLIQVRDPEQGYAAIGDPMIGVMEASLEKKDGKVKLEMQGMHLAGILFGASRKRMSNGRAMMWSACLGQCKGSHNGRGGAGDGCRCGYVRNTNRVFRR
uniref:PMI1/PMIR1-2 C-terminal domain-containing protein n=1 Tax=Oryza punctata TaxID=4537 RepID=A0A0E0M4H4_ORYPU